MGLDERGQLVKVPLMWHSILVSALPRAGKTFSARLLALYAALDPYVQLSVFDFKGSPDWRKFSLVADSFGFGLTISRHGDPLEIFGQTLERIRADVQDRNHRLSELAERHVDLCPDGKLTREIARDPRFGMPVRMLVMDEFQEIYDLGEASKEVAGAAHAHREDRAVRRVHPAGLHAAAVRGRLGQRVAAVHLVPRQPRAAVRAAHVARGR